MLTASHAQPWQKAANTDRWTEILFRALASRVTKRWRFVSFRGIGGGEWCGVVDVLAIRKDTAQTNHPPLKPGDLFDIVLVQMKGGSARVPNEEEIRRLRAVARYYHAVDVVLFTWKRAQKSSFYRLQGNNWKLSDAKEIFG